MLDRLGQFEKFVEFRIVLVDRTLEPRADQGRLGLVERPEVALELQHRLLPLTDHRHSLAPAGGDYKHPSVVSLTVTWSPDESGARGAEDRPFLIGVAGGSNSGKTTIATRLAELVGEDRLSLIELDSYYVERPGEPLETRAAANYDHPDAFDWELLNDHLAALAAGASVQVPIYDYAIHDRTDRYETVHASKVIVVEGILVLWEPRLRDRFDLKIFIDTPADLRLVRRLRRDVAERGRSPESIVDRYVETVRPAHERFIEPSKRHADVIVPEGGLNRPAIEVLLARVRELTLD